MGQAQAAGLGGLGLGQMLAQQAQAAGLGQMQGRATDDADRIRALEEHVRELVKSLAQARHDVAVILKVAANAANAGPV